MKTNFLIHKKIFLPVLFIGMFAHSCQKEFLDRKPLGQLTFDTFFKDAEQVLGYSLPSDWSSQIGISRARFYVSGTNLWTRQEYSGYSPEFPGGNVYTVGIDNGSYPIAKTILFGLDVSF